MPAQPQWIRDAAFASILYLYDEAPESMRPKIGFLNSDLPKIRDALFARAVPSKFAKKMVALWDQIRCTAWTDRCDIRDAGPNGARAAYIHYINVEDRVRKFAATCEKAPDGKVKLPRGLVLRLFAPAFNANNAARRICLECGAVFALRNDHERLSMKFCGGAKKCGKRVSSRKAKVAARAAGDAYTKVREHEKGSLPLERAEREIASSYNVEDLLIDLIDTGRVREQK